MGRHNKYTPEQIEFLAAGYRKWMLPDLTAEFNREFGQNRTVTAIKATLNRFKLTSGRSPGSIPGTRRALTPEQEIRLGEIYRKYPMKEAVGIFNDEQGTSFTQGQLTTYVHNHGINSGRTGRFKPGNKPSPKSGMKPGETNSGSFKKGHQCTTKKPMGHRRICVTSKYYLIKVPLKNPYTGAFGWYVPEHRWNWEQAHGPIPEGHKIAFYDGDRLNPALENLRLVSDAEMLYLNRNGWNDCPDELRDTMLALAKLHCEAFDREPSPYRKYQQRRQDNGNS